MPKHEDFREDLATIEKLDPSTEGASMDVVEQNIQQLRQLFPDVFTEGSDHNGPPWKVELEKLGELLGHYVEDQRERYTFDWHGKARARRIALTKSTGTLRPCPEESVNWDTTKNIVIEGDNLEVLKLLQKSYHNGVKMIYIDPPYNTGEDLIYPDKFHDNLDTYLKCTGQIGEDGLKISSNCESSGRFHTNWLNMMYPRLKVARNLLADDGVIFVSISDVELANLRILMNEIFGEENYVNCVCVKAKPSAGASGGGEDRRLKKNVEFLLIYSRNREAGTGLDLSKAYEESELMSHISAVKEAGKSWKYTRVVKDLGERKHVKTVFDGDANPIEVFEHSGFELVALTGLVSEENTLADVYFEFFESIFRDTNAQSSIRRRVIDALGEKDGLFSIDYIPRSGRWKGQKTTIHYKGPKKDQLAWLRDIAVKRDDAIAIRNKSGTLWTEFNWNNVSKEGEIAFPNGKKPIAFIQKMISLSTSSNQEHIVLDFFAGSGSTAHAVMNQNSRDGGNRKFILIQLPETISDSTEFADISDLCVQRLRNSIDAIGSKAGTAIDLGFRVLKLDSSNVESWAGGFENISDSVLKFENHLKQGRSEQDLLYELVLKLGLDLAIPIEVRKILDSNVFVVGLGALVVCLSDSICTSVVEGIAFLKDELQPERMRVVLKDSGFKDDVVKTNAIHILRQRGIEDVKSL